MSFQERCRGGAELRRMGIKIYIDEEKELLNSIEKLIRISLKGRLKRLQLYG